jgi:hypothetical protein
MKPDTLLKLYPKPWRDRYGGEFVALLQKEGTGPRVVLNVMAGAFDAWTSPRTASQMALDGPFGPAVLFRKTDTKDGLYSRSHWLYILAAIGVGLLSRAAGIPFHHGEGPAAFLSFFAGFQATCQFWIFRRFSVRTRIAAFLWMFVGIAGVPVAIHTFLHRVVYPWFGR